MTKQEILVARQEKFQQLIAEKDLDAILFLLPSRDGFDLYFSGGVAKTMPPYDAPLQSMDSCVLLAKGKKPQLIHASYITEVGEEDPLLTHFGPPLGDQGEFVWVLNQKAEVYIDALKGNKRLGLVNPEDLREEIYGLITRNVPEVEFVDVTHEANLLKAEKCEGEITLARENAALLDRVFARIPTILHPTALERDAANNIRVAGSEVGNISNIYSDWVIVHLTSAPDGGEAIQAPVPFPGRMIDMGDRVNVHVLAALKDAYSAACGRCFVLGTPCEETKTHWGHAVAAQECAEGMLAPGVTIAKIMKTVQTEVYEKNGLTYTPSNWIYGLGLSYAMVEPPMATPYYEDVPLAAGMVISVAPKVELPGKDPFICADTYLITEDGCERLTKTPRGIKTLFEI